MPSLVGTQVIWNPPTSCFATGTGLCSPVPLAGTVRRIHTGGEQNRSRSRCLPNGPPPSQLTGLSLCNSHSKITNCDPKALGLFPSSRAMYSCSILKNVLEFSNIFFNFLGKGQRCVASLSFLFHSWLRIPPARRDLWFWHGFLVMCTLGGRR